MVPRAPMRRQRRQEMRGPSTRRFPQEARESEAPEVSPLYKTRLCNFFVQGCCKEGNHCTFAHGEHDLRASPDFERTSVCPSMLRDGHCDRPDCRYAHAKEELRADGRVLKTRFCSFFLNGGCVVGEACRFAHSIAELQEAETLDAQRKDMKVGKIMMREQRRAAFAAGKFDQSPPATLQHRPNTPAGAHLVPVVPMMDGQWVHGLILAAPPAAQTTPGFAGTGGVPPPMPQHVPVSAPPVMPSTLGEAVVPPMPQPVPVPPLAATFTNRGLEAPEMDCQDPSVDQTYPPVVKPVEEEKVEAEVEEEKVEEEEVDKVEEEEAEKVEEEKAEEEKAEEEKAHEEKMETRPLSHLPVIPDSQTKIAVVKIRPDLDIEDSMILFSSCPKIEKIASEEVLVPRRQGKKPRSQTTAEGAVKLVDTGCFDSPGVVSSCRSCPAKASGSSRKCDTFECPTPFADCSLCSRADGCPVRPCAACNCGLRVLTQNTFLTLTEDSPREPKQRSKSL